MNTLGTNEVNCEDIIEFILRTIYNRPKKETTLEESRRSMMKVGEGKKRKYRSTKLVIPDRSSLLMKIKRSNLVAYPWKNCLSTTLVPLMPKHNGWIEVNVELVTNWFEGDPLPTDEVYDEHIDDLKHAAVEEIEDERLKESDSDVDEVSDAEYALSDEYACSGETDEDDDSG